jgi:hypothetical protein
MQCRPEMSPSCAPPYFSPTEYAHLTAGCPTTLQYSNERLIDGTRKRPDFLAH